MSGCALTCSCVCVYVLCCGACAFAYTLACVVQCGGVLWYVAWRGVAWSCVDSLLGWCIRWLMSSLRWLNFGCLTSLVIAFAVIAIFDWHDGDYDPQM